jgi:hypothetical protein
MTAMWPRIEKALSGFTLSLIIAVGSFADATAQTPSHIDLNSDGVIDLLDVDLLKSAFFSSDPDADLNNDGIVDFLDLGIMNSYLQGEEPEEDRRLKLRISHV